MRIVCDIRASLTDRYKSLIEHHSWNRYELMDDSLYKCKGQSTDRRRFNFLDQVDRHRFPSVVFGYYRVSPVIFDRCQTSSIVFCSLWIVLGNLWSPSFVFGCHQMPPIAIGYLRLQSFPVGNRLLRGSCIIRIVYLRLISSGPSPVISTQR